MTYTFSKKPENSLEHICLSIEDMEYILENHNNSNRDKSKSKLEELKKSINDGKWDYDFHEGRQIIFDCTSGELISGQHRMEAMCSVNKDKSDFSGWNVDAHYVDFKKWSERTIERRTATDIIQMNSYSVIESRLSKEQAVIISAMSAQIPLVKEGSTKRSGASAKKRTTTTELLTNHGSEFIKMYDSINKTFLSNKKLVSAAFILFFAEIISKKDFYIIVESKANEILSSASEFILTQEGWNSLPFNIAVLFHEKNSKGNHYSKLKQKVESNSKDQYEFKNFKYD